VNIKIHKVNKSDLSYISNVDVEKASNFADTTGMTISHYADYTKPSSASIPYSIEVVKESVPFIEEVEFCVVMRKKVDLTAIGVNEKTITNVGNDVGANEYPNKVPHKPSDFPPGFVELYKGE